MPLQKYKINGNMSGSDEEKIQKMVIFMPICGDRPRFNI